MTELSTRPSASPATARRPATGSGSATPTSGSASSEDRQAPGDEPIWGYAQEPSTADDPGRARRPTRSSTSSSPAPSSSTRRSASSRPTSGSRTAGSSASDGPATRRSATASSCRSGRTRRRSWAYGLIATPGAVDSHVHRSARQLDAGGAVGRRDDADHRRLRGAAVGDGADARGADRAGRSTSGSRRAPDPRTTADFEALLDAGAVGFKIHEDYGAYPELIDATLRFADAHDVAVSLHTDGLHEIGRARGHGRRDRRSDGPRLSRRGDRRRPRAGPARAGPRGEHHLLVDDADHPVRRRTRRPSTWR